MMIQTRDPQRVERRRLLHMTERQAPWLHRAYCDMPGMLTPWEIPTILGDRVLCYEPTEERFRHAAYSLGIPVDVQDLAWDESGMGFGRWFAPQSLASDVVFGVARCELGMDPHASIDWDDSAAACVAMGTGWHLMNQAQHFVLAVISQAYWNGQDPTKEPRGNTVYGEDSDNNHGIRQDAVTPGTASGTARTLTSLAEGGGQLLAWSHDGTPTGVFDMVGNVWKWTSRLRIVDWEIQIIPASAGLYADHGAGSSDWQAILADGTLVAPGTASTLHYSTDSGVYLSETQAGTGTSAMFKDVGAGAISPVPPILTALGLFPWSAAAPTVGRLYASSSGERLPIRGGSWLYGSDAGVAALNLHNSRANASTALGFRPAFAI